MTRKTTTHISIFVLCSIGILLCRQTLDDHLSILSGAVSRSLFCGEGGIMDCTRVIASDASWLFGLPLALWGIAYFLAVISLCMAGIVFRGDLPAAATRLGLYLCAAACLADVILGIIMLVEVRAVCGKCLLTYAINALLTVAFWRLRPTVNQGSPWLKLIPSWKGLRSELDGDYYENVVKLALLVLTMGSIMAILRRESYPFTELTQVMNLQVDQFVARMQDEKPEVDQRVFGEQPALGSAAAPLQIVAALDFTCSFCRLVARTLHDACVDHPESLRVAFVNFPMNTACNSAALAHEGGEEACWMARMAESAVAHGVFDAFCRGVLEVPSSRPLTRGSMVEALSSIGLDSRVSDASASTKDVDMALARDIEACRSAGIKVAPTLVVNGYLMEGAVPPWALERLLDSLIANKRSATAEEHQHAAVLQAPNDAAAGGNGASLVQRLLKE